MMQQGNEPKRHPNSTKDFRGKSGKVIYLGANIKKPGGFNVVDKGQHGRLLNLAMISGCQNTLCIATCCHQEVVLMLWLITVLLRNALSQKIVSG